MLTWTCCSDICSSMLAGMVVSGTIKGSSLSSSVLLLRTGFLGKSLSIGLTSSFSSLLSLLLFWFWSLSCSLSPRGASPFMSSLFGNSGLMSFFTFSSSFSSLGSLLFSMVLAAVPD